MSLDPRTPHKGSATEAAILADRCTHCGSVRTQEAYRTNDVVTFRCLHCWKTFTRSRSDEGMLPTDDAA